MNWIRKDKELSAEEKFQDQLDRLPTRDQALFLACITLHELAYDERNKPEPSHHKDLTFALLEVLKHTTSMDAAEHMLSWLETVPDEALTRRKLTLVFKQMVMLASDATAKAADDVMRLVELLPNPQKYGAPSAR